MTPDSPGVLVMGLGNLVHSDDGVGVHAIHRLQTDPRVPPEVSLIDGGTQGLSLIPHISGFARLLVIDAVDVGEAPGTIIRIEGKALEGLPGKPSVHQLGFADLMITLKLLDDEPEEVVVLGVQPLSTEWSAELTPPVQAALERLPDLVIAQLEIWGRKSVTAEVTI
jgi:hydrogenase maturation protease